jgi:Zn-finger nucleic acid-binding protein
MKCPVCIESDLLMTERLGVEIDYCPKCRGVWLDRGELDKIVERSDANAPREVRDDRGRDHDEGHRRDPRDREDHGRPYKKKSWLGDLFD